MEGNSLKRFGAIVFAAAVMCTLPAAYAQRGAGRAASGAAPANVETEEGIPVTDALVIKKCGTCHAKDDKGNLSRISWERATPEGWSEALKRMVRLNGLTITPDEARSVVKYLATYHGLAPEEAKPVMYIPEHRLIDETNIPNDSVRGACTTCHAMGRPMSWRRSKNDWRLLANLHVALYAQAETHFRRSGMGGGGGAGGGAGRGAATAAAGAAAAPTQEPLEVALEFLGNAAALHTPEWGTWSTRMKAPKLAGTWLVKAHLPGKGDYSGTLEITQGAAADEFKTKATLTSVTDGSVLSRTGTGLVYAGYSWRGRNENATKPPADMKPDDSAHMMREAMWFNPDQSSAEGRWFWGEYQEFGLDVTLTRVSAETHLTMLDRMSVKAGTTAKVKIYGDHVPADIKAADLDFGAGVKVKQIVSHSAGEMVVEIDVDAKAASGKRDVMAGRAILPGALAVYDKIDYIRVLPETSLARLGSEVHPKGYQQFEVMAYHRGADGKAHTADDIELGPVEVTWSVEEFLSVYGDDDKDFVGYLSPTALFTPASDGPNPERKFSRNNYGDVWIVAKAKDLKDKDGKPLTAKSYLVVTVPTYIKWDQPEVEK